MKQKITIVNYGTGNYFSIRNALEYLGLNPNVSLDKKTIASSDIILLPGVGSFNYAINNLKKNSLLNVIKNNNTGQKIIGICLGMQLLFSTSTEGGFNKGLDLIDGEVEILKKRIKVPNIGWQMISTKSKLFEEFENKSFYFLHSYYVKKIKKKNCLATSTISRIIVPSIVTNNKNIFGFQFHPEKSSLVGLDILKKIIFL